MRSRVYPLLLSVIVAIAWVSPAAATPARTAHPLRHAHHIDRQLDRRAAIAAAHGHYRQAARLDLRGDRLVARVERRVHRAHHRWAARHPRG